MRSRFGRAGAPLTAALSCLAAFALVADAPSARAQSTSGVAGSAAAATQSAGSVAQAPGTPATGALKPDEPSWLERQIAAARALFSPPNAAGGSQAAGRGTGGPPPVVAISRPIVKELVEWDEYTGRLDAVDTVEIRARVSGYLTDVHFKDGQMVKKGDLLYTLDSRPFERALDQARAEFELAQTKIKNAKKDVDRSAPLIRNRFITEKAADDRQNTYDEAESQAKVADAKVRSAELDLSFTKIYAPFDGRISRSSVSIGNYVIGGAQVSTLLTTIVTQDPVQVYFDVSENNLLKYKRKTAEGRAVGATSVGMPVRIALPDEPNFPHEGRLDFIDNRLDQGTGTLRVRALLDNSKGLFSPGMFARVRIAGSDRYPALLIPDESIGTDQSDRFVYVVGDDGIANRRKVEIGSLSDGMRIVRSGLSPDDWVIVRGVQRARQGQKVTPSREPIKLSSAAEVIAPSPALAKP